MSERRSRPRWYVACVWTTGLALLALAVIGVMLRAVAVPAEVDGAVATRAGWLAEHGFRMRWLFAGLAGFAGFAVVAFDGALRSPRSVARIAAIGMVMVGGALAVSVTDPVAAQLDAAIGQRDLDAVRPLLDWWARWLTVHAVLGIAAAVAYAASFRFAAPAPRPATLSAHERRLLFLLGSATFFEGYDRFIVILALPYIARDIGADESTLGWALFWIRIGALLSLPLAARADRHGRRQVLLLTVVGYTLATAVTAFTTSVTPFVLCQLIANVFLIAELSLAHVMIVEEFPAHLRGFGLGVIGGLAGLGAGVASMLFPIMQATPLGWRGLYLVGVLPLLFLAYLRSALPETRRWQEAHDAGTAVSRWRALTHRPHVGPLISLVTIAIATFAVIAPAFSFFSYVATTQHGWTPAQVSLTIVFGGGIGIIGWPLGGRLADAIGRRITGAIGLVGLIVAITLVYRGASGWMTVGFALLVFSEAWTQTVVAALATECFPTTMRSSAKAVVTNATIVGALVGLGAVGAYSEEAGGVARVISMLAVLNGISLVTLWTLPETARADLDALERRA